jgi:hypothetical protein
MKDNNDMLQGGKLKPEFNDSWAMYYAKFIKEYENELFNLPNVHVHGLIDIKSNLFVEILAKCNFVIYPSCSEGGSPSVLTVVGNGGLIPIISHETTISTGYEIFINHLTLDGIDKAISIVRKMSKSEIVDLQENNYKNVLEKNNQTLYYSMLKKAINKILTN